MNAFEQKISAEYNKNHAVPLLQEIKEFVSDNSNLDNPQQILETQMSIAARNRFVYLALKEYHAALSRFLAESGIVLPDLDTLVAKSAQELN